jgi:hypothetical protein
MAGRSGKIFKRNLINANIWRLSQKGMINMGLKLTGRELWTCKGYDHHRKTVKGIRKRTNKTPQDDEEKILKYLDSGIQGLYSMLNPFDLIAKKKLDYSVREMLTDGVWLWPRLLTYYVREYHYRIDIEFLEHMKKNNWEIPKLSEDEINKLIDFYQG